MLLICPKPRVRMPLLGLRATMPMNTTAGRYATTIIRTGRILAQTERRRPRTLCTVLTTVVSTAPFMPVRRPS